MKKKNKKKSGVHEIDFSNQIKSANEGKTLNKPFRTPKGPKKFSVYVNNDKGNVVKVNFGDPNMEIKRDNPARRRSFRARHGCDNPGPKWKANYWSCKMWSNKTVTDLAFERCAFQDETFTLEVNIQAKNKGLWHNIQQKKKRMGKNYRPAKPGSPDRPSQDALKKAQGSDYLNEKYEWDGETEFEQNELLKINPSLSQAEEVENELE